MSSVIKRARPSSATIVLLSLLLAMLAVVGVSSEASAAGTIGCRASVLRTSGFPLAALNQEPVIANGPSTPCSDDTNQPINPVGVSVLASVTTPVAETTKATNSADSSVATATVGPNASLNLTPISTGVLQSHADIACQNGQPVAEGNSLVASAQVGTTTITNLTQPQTIIVPIPAPAGSQVVVYLNRQLVDTAGGVTTVTQRALEVDTIVSGVLSTAVVVAEAQASYAGNPCQVDTTPPACALSAKSAGPPATLTATVQDTDSGIASIVVNSQTNATVSVPTFTPGTTAPLDVVATKTDQSQKAIFEMTVTDVAGNSTVCDPLILHVQAGRAPAVQTGTISKTDHIMTVLNGSPGLESLTVAVDGRPHVFELTPGENTSIDIGQYLLLERRNVIAAVGRGAGSAELMFGNI